MEYKPVIPFKFILSDDLKFLRSSDDVLTLFLKKNYPIFKIHAISILDIDTNQYIDNHYVVGKYINGEYIYIDIYGIWRDRDIINFWNNKVFKTKDLDRLGFCITNNYPNYTNKDIETKQKLEKYSKMIIDFVNKLN